LSGQLRFGHPCGVYQPATEMMEFALIVRLDG
jgi:hypothetical protein